MRTDNWMLFRMKGRHGGCALFFCPSVVVLGASCSESDDAFYLTLYVPAFHPLIEIKKPQPTMLPEGAVA